MEAGAGGEVAEKDAFGDVAEYGGEEAIFNIKLSAVSTVKLALGGCSWMAAPSQNIVVIVLTPSVLATSSLLSISK